MFEYAQAKTPLPVGLMFPPPCQPRRCFRSDGIYDALTDALTSAVLAAEDILPMSRVDQTLGESRQDGAVILAATASVPSTKDSPAYTHVGSAYAL